MRLLCDLTALRRAQRDTRKKRKTFLSGSFDFSLKKKKRNPECKLKLEVNTFLPTTPGRLEECSESSAFLSQAREHPVFIPLPCTQKTNSICTGKLGYSVTLGPRFYASVCAFTSLTDSLHFYHLVFALVITSKRMTPRCVKCNADHHGG